MSSFFRLKQVSRQVDETFVESSPLVMQIHADQREAYENIKDRSNEYIAKNLVPAGAPDFAVRQSTERWVLELVVQGARTELEPLAIFAKSYTRDAFEKFYNKSDLKSIEMQKGFWVKDDFFKTSFSLVLNVSSSTRNAPDHDELFSYRVDTFSNRLSIEGYRLSQACGVVSYRISLIGQDSLSMPSVHIPDLLEKQGIKVGIEKSEGLLDVYLDMPCGLFAGYNDFVVTEGYWRAYIVKGYPLATIFDKGYTLQQVEDAVTAFVDYAFRDKTYTVSKDDLVPSFSVESLCLQE